ncbi:hypothetical protein XELAEV_18028309mg, partial [Xenopus laevis]
GCSNGGSSGNLCRHKWKEAGLSTGQKYNLSLPTQIPLKHRGPSRSPVPHLCRFTAVAGACAEFLPALSIPCGCGYTICRPSLATWKSAESKMADHGWGGWPDPEAGSASNDFSLKDPLPDTSNKKYVWNGTFGEKYITAECKVIVAYCGRCGAEGDKAFRRISSFCHVCGFGCWMGPLAVVEESPGPMILSPAPPAQEQISPRVSDVAAAIGNKPAPPICPPPMPRCSSPTAVGKEQASVAMGCISLNPPAKVATPATRGRGHGRVPSTFQRSTASTKDIAAASKPSSSEGDSFLSLASPEPDWAEMDFGPLSTPYSSSRKAVHFFFSELLPPNATPEDTSFWVYPGHADPKKLCTVSRIQRIINIKGYFIPYAPEWIYDNMEKHLDEWIYGELLRKEGIGSGGLFHSDSAKRERDLSFLCNVVHEWWYGRTILKHSVKICGKFKEERHFILSDPISNGGCMDKPHPSYYLSYEDTLEKYGVRP